ncbi:hypothetical protein [Candidatus Methanarcanum hacksteinii]|uniref:hypothetical protein n=1 Tax=Candidatus Methanarcanum hacksteinii TaxID=2911857 RepID=UPI0037DC0635
MENKTKILAFAAVALMFAVCFIGFVAINDDAVDASDANAASVKIGGITKEYATIEEAVEKAQPSESGNIATITLLKDVTTNKTLSFTKSGQYTLDIGEFTLTQGSNGYMISVGGSAPPAYPIDTINTSAQITIKGTGNIITNNTTFRSYGTMIFGENGVGPTVTMGNSVNSHSMFKVEEGSLLTINGGTFNLSSDPSNKVTRLMQNFGTTVINNGTFNGDIELWSYTKSDGTKYDSTVTINEGTFNGKLLRQSDSDLQFVLDDKDKFIVEGGSFTDIANAVGYATSDATITLAENVTLSSSIVVTKSVTIDLNGHEITGDKIRAIHVKSGTLTLEGTGVVTATGIKDNGSSVIRVGDPSSNASSAGIVVGEGVTISSDCCYAMSAFGKNTEINVTVNGTLSVTGDNATFGNNGSAGLCKTNVTIGPKGKVLSEKEYAIYFPGDGTLNINGTVCGFGALEIKSGTANVGISNGASITATAKTVGHVKNNNGTSTSGYAIAVVENKAYTGMPTVVIEDGSTIVGEIDIIKDDTVVNDKKGSITINGGSFTDIANAVKYAESNTTIALADDISITDSVLIGKSITINLNGHKITSNKDVFVIANDCDNFTLDGNEGLITTSANDMYAIYIPKLINNVTITVNGGSYEGKGAFLNYGVGTNLMISNVNVNAERGIWCGNGPANTVQIKDATIVATGEGVYLGTVKSAVLENVKITASTCIEVKSGNVVISGDSIIKATADYKEDLDMNNNGSGGSVAAICINNAYVHITKDKYPEMTYVSVSIADSVKIESKSNDQKMICITSGYKHGTTKSIENTPIYVNSDLNIEKIGILCKGTVDSPVKSPIIYNGIAYAFNQDMYNVVKSDPKVNGYDISLAEGVELTVGTVNGTVTLAKGAELTITKDSTFTGTINGPDNNKLVANGMKAGEGGITITGGSLIINGVVVQESGSYSGATVTVTGDGIKISGSLGANATMVIEKDTIVTVKSGDKFSFDGTITNNGTLRIEDSTTITTVNTSKVVNNGIVIDERAKNASAVPVDKEASEGIVVAKNNADKYKGAGIDVIVQDPETAKTTDGTVVVDDNKFIFIDTITTTGKLNIVMNDGYKQYTVTIPEGTAIAAGTVISVSFIEYQSDSVTRYQINTPGIENFSMKLPCQIGFKKAKVYCDDSELGVSKVRYDAGTGYVTFDASHNSVFTIVLSNTSPAGTTTVSGGDTTNDYSLVIAITVLVASLGFLAHVIKKR